MSQQLYACIHAAEFPAQALLRLRPELRAQPVAVLDGRAPLETVCSLNALARRKGAALCMTRLEAEAISNLRLLPRSIQSESAARTVLLESAANFSPRLEDVSAATACACVLDIAGTERLFGPPHALAQRLRTALIATGFRATVAVSRNFHAARIKAASARGIVVIPAEEEAAALASLPVDSLDLPGHRAEAFALWGVRTLRELAALPEVELIARLGQGARVWRDLALGRHPHTFQPIEPEFQLAESCEFEAPVEQIESLLFMCARMIECLQKRAASRALCLAQLTACMKLEAGQMHTCAIRPALPSIDCRFLLKLLQLEIAAHPPAAAVVALSLSADAGQSSTVQLGLFAPQMPEPSRLDVSLARLKAIVGEERVGSPVLEDSHRAASFRMERFVAGAQVPTPDAGRPRLALRRMRPPAPVRVEMRAMKPVAFRDGVSSCSVTAAYGPWKASGCWWSAGEWNLEEWDVLAESGNGASLACLLVFDGVQNQWRLEAFYD